MDKETLLKERVVLLVDDNRLSTESLRIMLESYGCVVDVAFDGREAIGKIQISDYDVVLLDVRMPVLDGYETARIIRNTLKKEMPIIALSGLQDDERYVSAGINAQIVKPIDMAQLIDKMRSLL